MTYLEHPMCLIKNKIHYKKLQTYHQINRISLNLILLLVQF